MNKALIIDKSALVAEIENLLKPVRQRLERDKNDPWDSDIAVYKFGKQLIKNINTREVKDVDLEDEVKRYDMSEIPYSFKSTVEFAKHFFELGLKAQKGE